MMDDFYKLCKEGERIDDLLSPSFKIIQHDRYFRFSIDAVLLAHFTSVKAGELVVDLGTGTGVIPLLLAGRQRLMQVIGIEIQNILADMAKRSVEMNNLTECIDIKEMDLKIAAQQLGYEIADVVTANPPYRAERGGEKNISEPVAMARHEICCTLQDVIKTAGDLLKYRGRFYMVHLAERLSDIMATAKQFGLEPKILRMVHSFVSEPAKLVLIQMVKGARPSLRVMPPLIIYDRPGSYSSEAYKYYYPEEKG